MTKRTLFIAPAASRTGAPLLLLKFLEWLKANSSLSLELLLRCDGELSNAFAAACPVHSIQQWIRLPERWDLYKRAERKLVRSVEQELSAILRSKFPAERFPIVYFNTVANLDLLQHFATSDRHIICHVHELSHAVSALDRKQALIASATRIDSFIAASGAVLDYLHSDIRIPLSKISVVHEFPVYPVSNGSDVSVLRREARSRLNLDQSDFVVGMCGNIEWRKGIDLFIQLAAKLKESLSDRKLRCVWIGGKPDRDEIRHDINHAGVSDVVMLLGEHAHPETIFPAFDVFAMTSREDPYPAAMLEAATAGIPIVCFDKSGGGPEFINAGQCGLIAPYLDVDAFAQHCLKLANDAKLREELGRNAQSHVQSHLIDVQAPKLLAVIEGQS